MIRILIQNRLLRSSKGVTFGLALLFLSLYIEFIHVNFERFLYETLT